MILQDNTDNIGDAFNFFPTTCIDNFYKDPDGIRNFALSLNYNDNSGNFPGLRTDNLNKIDAQFYKQSVNKLLSLFFQVDITDLEKIDWYATTNFQKIYPYHRNKNNILNMGDIHTDNIFGGIAAVIYLDPNPSMDSGTSFYRNKKTSKFYLPKQDYMKIKTSCYKDGKCEEFSEALRDNNSNYEKTLEVKNLYNRAVAYNPSTPHGQTNLCVDNEDFRLTQVFFIWFVTTDLKNPVQRINMFDI